MKCIFVSDLHGYPGRYEALYDLVSREEPDAVFMGGDLLPVKDVANFFQEYISRRTKAFPTRFFAIMGNDDPRGYEPLFVEADGRGDLEYIHMRPKILGDLWVIGYSYVPPTPFMLKDWERYDVSRYVDVGCIHPDEGIRTVEQEDDGLKTIKEDLEEISLLTPPESTIYLFHSPPYGTSLDLTGNTGILVDHAPVDTHVGSISIKNFIEERKPLLTLHGHIHESALLTGSWKERIGETYALSAAHNGPELAVVCFDTERRDRATRMLL